MTMLKLILLHMFLFTGVASANEGILVLAHGTAMDHIAENKYPPEKSQCEMVKEHGDHKPWEATVCSVTEAVAKKVQYPVETAFGMYSLDSFQHAVDRLAKSGIQTLRIIPLYVNSNSSVIRQQKYMFGLLEQGLQIDKVILPKSVTNIIFTAALDQSEHLSYVIAKRAEELSSNHVKEEVIMVAHGPVDALDDEHWLRDLNIHAQRVQVERAKLGKPFFMIHPFTVKDDAPKEERDRKTKELRQLVQSIKTRGNKAHILPVLLAKGGIEKGILERLEGLEFHYVGNMLAPDDELVHWIESSIVQK